MGLLWTTISQHDNSTHHPSTIHKHVHRAPTDDSVKLLREMEAAAENEILQAIHVRDNGLEGVVVVKHFSAHSIENELIALFKLNGKSYEVRELIPNTCRLTPEHAVRALAAAIAEKITEELMVTALNQKVLP